LRTIVLLNTQQLAAGSFIKFRFSRKVFPDSHFNIQKLYFKLGG